MDGTDLAIVLFVLVGAVTGNWWFFLVYVAALIAFALMNKYKKKEE